MPINMYFSEFRAPDFELSIIGSNRTFRLYDFIRKREQFVFLHFGCVELFQREAGERYRLENLLEHDDVAIVWIYLHQTAEDIEKYTAGSSFPMLHDPKSIIPRLYYFDQLPAVYLLAPDGRFVITDMHSLLPQPISALELWKENKISEILDKATSIWEEEWRKSIDWVNLSDYGFPVEKRYYHFGWTDDPHCRVQRSVANALADARTYLRHWNCFKDWNFLVWDSYRDFATHRKMVGSFRRRIADVNWSAGREFIEAEIQKYASAVSRIYLKRGSHRQGTAVDITLVDEKGRKLEMGTDHDELSERAHPFYYKDLFPRSNSEREFHGNRMLLHEAMESAGFTPHSYEWWHFDFIGKEIDQ
ncbi:MAG: hypothetical protein HYT98_00445 [Candidatus Sungbacteria bacterium]|nr:hypothetical protein [Candidatus Sungbacteria bacterium]